MPQQILTIRKQKLASEIRIWANLDHDFVLPLLGYFVEGENMMPALISEWMERGTLHDVMRTFPRGGIDTLIMVRSDFSLRPHFFNFIIYAASGYRFGTRLSPC